MEIAVAILTLLLRQVPDLITVIRAWADGNGDDTDPIYAKVSAELDIAEARLNAKLKKKV